MKSNHFYCQGYVGKDYKHCVSVYYFQWSVGLDLKKCPSYFVYDCSFRGYYVFRRVKLVEYNCFEYADKRYYNLICVCGKPTLMQDIYGEELKSLMEQKKEKYEKIYNCGK
ncbi:MAG: hypothetical protein M0R51_15530 [Clostridia bacterium]|jgi:hypothetical protein|nr:hypothetical protein [Clostridia bacterium]